jgi:protocatechuate 3,4-dioxygenase beta subunit
VSLAVLCLGLAVVLGATRWVRSCKTGSPHGSRVQRDAPASGRAAAPVASTSPASTASLTVVVTDEHGPLRDARVRLTPREGEIVVVKTGADGVARADRLAPGSWRISASADGHVPAASPARLLAPGAADRMELRLVSGGRTLRGTVSDTASGPVAGARIDAARIGPEAVPDDAVSTTVTGDDGGYRMTVAEGSLWIAVTSDDYAPQSRRVDVGPAGAVADFALMPGGVIEGVVEDEQTREPVAGASVRARRTAREWLGTWTAAERRAVAGSDGRFRLTGLRPGDWQLDAAAPPRGSRESTHVGLAVGEQVGRVELTIGTTPALRGHVVDEADAPAPGVTVHAVGRSIRQATADAAGSFVFDGLRSGSYILSAESSAYLHALPTSVWLTDRDIDGVVVHVRRGLVVKGHVEPRQACRVQHEFEVAIGRQSFPVPDVATGPDGEFALAPFDGGAATLIARCPGGDEGELHVQVAAGMPDTVLAVTPGASLAGRVVGGDGAPVQGVQVVANAPDAMTALEAGRAGARLRISHGQITSGDQAVTDLGGRFEIRGLAPGRYGFQVLDRGKPLQARGAWPVIELAAGGHRTDLELAVELARGVIGGTVTGPAHRFRTPGSRRFRSPRRSR